MISFPLSLSLTFFATCSRALTTVPHPRVLQNDIAFAQELLDHGAPIDAKDNAG